MIIELILALFLGLIAGTITGLIPGIHINLVSALILSSIGMFAGIPVIILAVFIVSMTMTHSFLDFIPSIFLGAPDEDTSLSVLPGHEMLIKGKGYEAIVLTLLGGLLGLFIVLIFTPLFLFIFPLIYPYLSIIMFFVLLFVNLYLIFQEKNSRFSALFIFLLAGFLGLATLNLQVQDSLLPLLTGLFGSSSLITSIIKKQKIPKQKILKLKEIKISKKDFLLPGLGSFLAAPLCSFLPALGTGQAAVIGSEIIQDSDRRRFLILQGSINLIISGLSFIAVYSINKARTGTAVALQKILENFTFSDLLTILTAILISGLLAFFLSLSISKIFARKISDFSYKKVSILVLIFLFAIIFIFSGFLGLIIFIIATFTGLIAILLNIRRTHLMGCLMLLKCQSPISNFINNKTNLS